MKGVAPKHIRTIMLVLTAFLGVGLGAVSALPLYRRDFVRVEFPSVSVAAELAADPEAHRIGLSGREALAEKSGMLFLFDHADYWGVWTKGMRFPIDAIWMKNGVIADIEERVLPPEYGTSDFSVPVHRPDVSADMVLEVKAGLVDAYDLRIGDPVNAIFRGAALGRGAVKDDVASAAPFPGREYFIDSLRASPARGTGFAVTGVKEENGAYKKFSIAYVADRRPLTGVMNVPIGPVPVGGFPILILNHGLIRPEIYFSGRGSKREQDFFSRRGYVTIHPDYRGYSSTSPEFPLRHDFYAGYTEDMLALIDALNRARPQFIDVNRMGLWGHSMGGGIAARAMVLNHDIRAYVLFAPVSASVEDNFYELAPEEVAWIRKTYGPAGSPAYQKISPLSYFSDVAAPVQLHHGTGDAEVPIAFSEKMFQALRQYGKKSELFTYPGEKHEFTDAWPLATSRALQFFDKYVKGAR